MKHSSSFAPILIPARRPRIGTRGSRRAFASSCRARQPKFTGVANDATVPSSRMGGLAMMPDSLERVRRVAEVQLPNGLE